MINCAILAVITPSFYYQILFYYANGSCRCTYEGIGWLEELHSFLLSRSAIVCKECSLHALILFVGRYKQVSAVDSTSNFGSDKRLRWRESGEISVSPKNSTSFTMIAAVVG